MYFTISIFFFSSILCSDHTNFEWNTSFRHIHELLLLLLALSSKIYPAKLHVIYIFVVGVDCVFVRSRSFSNIWWWLKKKMIKCHAVINKHLLFFERISICAVFLHPPPPLPCGLFTLSAIYAKKNNIPKENWILSYDSNQMCHIDSLSVKWALDQAMALLVTLSSYSVLWYAHTENVSNEQQQWQQQQAHIHTYDETVETNQSNKIWSYHIACTIHVRTCVCMCVSDKVRKRRQNWIRFAAASYYHNTHPISISIASMQQYQRNWVE